MSGPKPELGEASDGASSQSIDVREHVETVELNSLNVLHTRAAAVLVVLMHEHLHRRNVHTTLAKLKCECARQPAHASATCAYRRVQNHELTRPCPLAQAVEATCARRSGDLHPRRCA